MRDFADETEDASVSDVLRHPGQRYVMMDIGGRAHYSSQKKTSYIRRSPAAIRDILNPDCRNPERKTHEKLRKK